MDAALVAAERGATLQPGPFIPTNVVNYTLSEAVPAPLVTAVLGDLVSGEAAATWAPVGTYDRQHPASLTVREAADGFVVSGEVSGVQDVGDCRWLLLSADTSEFCGHLLVPLDHQAVRLTPSGGGLDVTRRFFDVAFGQALIPEANLVERGSRARALMDRQVAVAALLTAAESVGAMDANFHLALDYSKVRIAFGRPIGSFQGVKHALADTSLSLEMAKGSRRCSRSVCGR